MDVTVVVATYGESAWSELAAARAIPSALELGVPVVHSHAASLQEARNAGLALVDTEWVVFLDADDELEPGYVDELAKGTADIRVPAVRYVGDGQAPPAAAVPRVVGHTHDCGPDCLPEGNFIVIGAAARAQVVRDAGGFNDFEWCEDWDLWIRCWLAGASIEIVPAAVYRAHVRENSRNRAPRVAERRAVADAIRSANFGPGA